MLQQMFYSDKYEHDPEERDIIQDLHIDQCQTKGRGQQDLTVVSMSIKRISSNN